MPADHPPGPPSSTTSAPAREHGATGVPLLAVDRRYGAVSAQPADLLLQVVEQAWADPSPAVARA